MKQPKVKRIRKLWHSGLRSLPDLTGKRHRPDHDYSTIEIPVGRNEVVDLTDDDIYALANALKDEALARRVRALQADKHPYGTAPEMVALDYLQRNNRTYIYQAEVFGGHMAGGLVPDFAIQGAGGWLVWAIQGIYWHNIPGKRTKDTTDKLRMLGTTYHGQVITDVIFVWEQHIIAPNPGREQVLANAAQGIEQQQSV